LFSCLGLAESERDVVVHVREVRGRTLRLRAGGRCRRGLARRRALLRLVAAVIHAAAHAVATAHALAAAQHLHVLGDDVGRVTLDAVLVGVLAGLQAAFDVDRGALLEVLAHDLGQAAEERDAVPFGQFLLFAGLAVLRLVRGGDRDVRDGVAARHVADFRVAAEVADDDDLVN